MRDDLAEVPAVISPLGARVEVGCQAVVGLRTPAAPSSVAKSAAELDRVIRREAGAHRVDGIAEEGRVAHERPRIPGEPIGRPCETVSNVEGVEGARVVPLAHARSVLRRDGPGDDVAILLRADRAVSGHNADAEPGGAVKRDLPGPDPIGDLRQVRAAARAKPLVVPARLGLAEQLAVAEEALVAPPEDVE